MNTRISPSRCPSPPHQANEPSSRKGLRSQTRDSMADSEETGLGNCRREERRDMFLGPGNKCEC